ncbi:thiolase family protein [Paraburkholderia sp. SIMBA_049]
MSDTMPANRQSSVAVVGIGHTSYGRRPEHDACSLGLWALDNALGDCGLSYDDIDGLILNRITDYQRFATLCNINPAYTLTTPAHGRFSAICIQTAVAAIEAGLANVVALVYGNNGRSAGVRYAGASAPYDSEAGGLWFPYGMTSPGAYHALMMQRHMAQYGTSERQLGIIASTFRRHASANPDAVMRKPYSVDEYLESPFICEPLRLLDHCLINDGGVAMIVTTAERAAVLPGKPVFIRGYGQASSFSQSDFPPEDFWGDAMSRAGRHSYAMADLEPADMDGLMIYDNFTPTVLFSLEGFGYCARGESGAWVEEGHLALGGKFPANTSGGHLSESYMQGWNLHIEAIRQLRGSATGRQIEQARHIHYMAAAPVVSSIIYAGEPR